MPTLKEITTSYNALALGSGQPTVARFPSVKEAKRRMTLLKKQAPVLAGVEATEAEVDVKGGPAEDQDGDQTEQDLASDEPEPTTVLESEPTAEEVLGRATARRTRSQAAVDKLVEKLRAQGADVQVIVIKGINVPVRKLARKPRLVRAAANTNGKPSLAKRAEELLMKGATNDELWEVFQKEYGLDDTKKSYPGWYRNSLKRQGKLPVDC